MSPKVTLEPMAPRDLEAFIDEEVADYADERVLDGTWSLRVALECLYSAAGYLLAEQYPTMRQLHKRLSVDALDPDRTRLRIGVRTD